MLRIKVKQGQAHSASLPCCRHQGSRSDTFTGKVPSFQNISRAVFIYRAPLNCRTPSTASGMWGSGLKGNSVHSGRVNAQPSRTQAAAQQISQQVSTCAGTDQGLAVPGGLIMCEVTRPARVLARSAAELPAPAQIGGADITIG